MTIEEILQLVRAKNSKEVTYVQELLLRKIWVGQTYREIADASHYGDKYLRNVASGLWQILSEIFDRPIDKSNFREVLESRVLSVEESVEIAAFYRSQDRSTFPEYPTGPVPVQSSFYIERPPIEQLVYEEIAKPGSMIRIKAPRKMGKTSLMLRILDFANNLGYRTVNVDFQQAEEAVLKSLDKLLRWLCANLSRQLRQHPRLDEYWDPDMGSKMSCTTYLQTYLLEASDAPLVVGFNEVNILFKYPQVACEFLPLLRSWYEQAKYVETLEKLRTIVVYSTESSIFLGLNHSPFNVGLPIQLPNFTSEQVLELARRHELYWFHRKQCDRLMAMVGGHPYLVQLALYHLANPLHSDGDFDRFLAQACTQAGIYRTHLRNVEAILQREPELLTAFKRLLRAKERLYLDPRLAYKLESLGLVFLDGKHCTPSCQLYQCYFHTCNADGECDRF